MTNKEPERPAGWMSPEEYFARLQKFPTVFRELTDYVLDGEPMVLLEKRPADDPFSGYANRYATLGSTVLMREKFADFATRHRAHEKGVTNPGADAPPWIFCGVLSTPNTGRHHGELQLFARVWPSYPKIENGEWILVSELEKLDVVPSIRTVIEMQTAVLFQNQPPQFREFLGDDL
jgi:hypothetical protein